MASGTGGDLDNEGVDKDTYVHAVTTGQVMGGFLPVHGTPGESGPSPTYIVVSEGGYIKLKPVQVNPAMDLYMPQDVVSATGNVNGNSKSSSKPQHGYEIKDNQTGDVHKYGISGGKLNKDGTSRRANNQVNKLNKTAGTDRFSARVVKKNMAGRQKGLNWEKGKVKGYKKANPGNNSPEANDRPKTD